MKKKRILSFIMSLALLGTSNLLFASNSASATEVKEAKSISDYCSVMKSNDSNTYTVIHNTPLMTGEGGTGYKIRTVYKRDTVKLIYGIQGSTGADGKTWVKVSYKGATGWICYDAIV
ncbi:hypothetical protein UT300005_19790 [Clostridium sp. CTA-5]